jgi:hypothetical protein
MRFDALSKPTPVHAAMRVQHLSDRQGVRRSRRLDRAHVPKRKRAKLVKGDDRGLRGLPTVLAPCS